MTASAAAHLDSGRGQGQLSTHSALLRFITPLPLNQGELDGLCGLYAVVNALRLASRAYLELDAGHCRALFATGIDLLAQRGRLARVLKDGMGPELRRALVRALAGRLQQDTGLRVRVRPLLPDQNRRSHRAMTAALEAALDRGAVALMTLSGVHDHYTVVRGYRATRWQLYDSGGLHWLVRAACGSPRSSKRHRIDPGAIETIEVTS